MGETSGLQTGIRRSLKACAATALALCISALASAGATAAAPIKVLSPEDASAYAAAFQAAAAGDFDSASVAASTASDRTLVGYLELQRLMSPRTRASYPELKAWLGRYGDLPGADRALQLARKRKPRAEADPTLAVITDTGEELLLPAAGAQSQAAREAFYAGDLQTAYRLAEASGERWIAALCAYRLNRFADALDRFQTVAADPKANEWLRAGAAYWAARSAIAAGSPELAPDLLRLASRSPATFYGMLAERELGLEPGADPQAYILAQAGFGPAPPAADAMIVKTAYPEIGQDDLERLVRTEPKARRAVALSQIGRTVEAAQELRAGYAAAGADSQRRLWMGLALELNSPAVAEAQARRARGFDPDDYPTPKLEPTGGFTLDKALVYAMVRQESRFDPYAVSGKGAVGLMQLMPTTAARAAGDDRLAADTSPLYDPAFNLRVGQDYLELLMTQVTGNDLLPALAAYNGGPANLIRAQQLVGTSDPLLLMECLPAAETRAYVQKVMASYWIYRRMFGESEPPMDAVGRVRRPMELTLNR